MPGNPAILPPRRNVGPGGAANDYWNQPGFSYGVSDTGQFMRYRGKGADALVDADAANNFLPNRWNFTVTRLTHGQSEIEAEAGYYGTPGLTNYVNEVLLSFWEMEQNQNQKPLLSADFPFGFVNLNVSPTGSEGLDYTIAGCAGSSETKLAIKAAIEDSNPIWGTDVTTGQSGVVLSSGTCYIFDDGRYPPYNTPISALNPINGENNTYTYLPCPSADYQAAFTLYKLMQSGVSDFPLEASVLKYTRFFSSLYGTSLAYSHINQIISTGSMASIEGASGLFFITLPTQPTPGQYIVLPGDLQYGWYKTRPSVSRVNSWKWRTEQHYQFGLWPVALFGYPL